MSVCPSFQVCFYARLILTCLILCPLSARMFTIGPSVCHFACLPACLPVCLSASLFVLSVCLSVCLLVSVCQFACFPVCQSVCLSVSLSVCLSVCLSLIYLASSPQALTPGDNSARIPIETAKYTQVVIYDHITRRKT